jgi:hypothetical protein
MPSPPSFSLTILCTLLVICGASLAMFVMLVRRWTTQRQWTTLCEWARLRRFRLTPRRSATTPAALAALLKAPIQVSMQLTHELVVLAQLKSDQGRWNVLVRKSPAVREAAAMRPAGATLSLIDQLSLEPFPTLSVGNRFAVLGSGFGAARALSDSPARTLVPQDIGLLVVDEWVVLDFSTRPFDPIELDRMLALSQQLSQLA